MDAAREGGDVSSTPRIDAAGSGHLYFCPRLGALHHAEGIYVAEREYRQMQITRMTISVRRPDDPSAGGPICGCFVQLPAIYRPRSPSTTPTPRVSASFGPRTKESNGGEDRSVRFV